MAKAKNESNEIRITRIYDAPVQTVWDAWTDLAQVAQWWGPRGFTITTHKKDLRPGGVWDYTMHGPDGVDYPNTTTYHEVEPCARLVYDHGANATQPPLFRVSVTFKAIGKKTEMDMTMRLATPEKAAETRKFIKAANGNSTWDRLGEHLEKAANKDEVFIINRSFDASIETLFEMWTDPKHFAKWLPPTGMEMHYLRSEIKVGATTLCALQGGGMTMHVRQHYLEIERPTRIVYTQQFVDEKEVMSRHPGAPLWPETMRTTVTLTAEGPEQTRVTVLWQVEGAATAAEIAAFVAEKPGMTLGWTGSFDKLDALLEA